MRMKTITSYDYVTIRMANAQNTDASSAGEDVGKQEFPLIAGEEPEEVQSLWKTVRRFLATPDRLLLEGPAIALLGI